MKSDLLISYNRFTFFCLFQCFSTAVLLVAFGSRSMHFQLLTLRQKVTDGTEGRILHKVLEYTVVTISGGLIPTLP